MIRQAFMIPFAEALFNIGIENNTLSVLEQEFQAFIDLLDDKDNHFQAFITDPRAPKELKKQALEKTLKNQVSKTFYHFLMVIIDKHVYFYIRDCFYYFREIVDNHLGRLRAKIISVIDIDKATEDKVVDNLMKYFKVNEIILEKAVDPNIIGGVIIRTKDSVIDLSLQRELNEMKRNIMQSKSNLDDVFVG